VETLVVYTPPEPLLHAKVYVADDEVAIGSANFTVSGMRHNLECAAFLNGRDVAEDVIRQVDELMFGKAIVLKREDD
jgi:phosphatidylserine/phosphatidylglycerophosphate/cardiolipin synthase-like enzyme